MAEKEEASDKDARLSRPAKAARKKISPDAPRAIRD